LRYDLESISIKGIDDGSYNFLWHQHRAGTERQGMNVST